MLETWANTIVICALGGGIGATLSFMIHVAPQSYLEAGHSPAREGESYWAAAQRRAEEQREIISSSAEARPMKLATAAGYGLTGVLVLTAWLSPVHLGWWTLLTSIVAGACFVELIFYLARTKRLRPSGRSFLNPLS
jgi:VIT1/CCC1 family predicted Fe2+/Mn2+ transporter